MHIKTHMQACRWHDGLLLHWLTADGINAYSREVTTHHQRRGRRQKPPKVKKKTLWETLKHNFNSQGNCGTCNILLFEIQEADRIFNVFSLKYSTYKHGRINLVSRVPWAKSDGRLLIYILIILSGSTEIRPKVWPIVLMLICVRNLECLNEN